MAKDGMTTVTTRFNDAELATLKRAVSTKEWSLAQLVRAGAYEKAVNIVNASGSASHAVRRLLSSILSQLLDAKIEIWGTNSQGDDVILECVERLDEATPTNLSRDEVDRLITVIRRLGAELAPLLAEERDRLHSDDDSRLADLIDPNSSVESETPED